MLQIFAVFLSIVEQVKIDRRTGSKLITMDEIKKRLKERYLQLKREHGWSEDEMTLNMKSSNNQSRNIKKGNKCKKLGHYTNECRNEEDSSGDDKHVTFAMMCFENSEEEKYENGEEENKQKPKNPDDDERKVDPGTARNTELMQSYKVMFL